MRVYHCPGHGFGLRESGIVHGGIVERDWVVTIAQDVHAAIWGWGVEQKIGRQDKAGKSYQERADAAKEWQAKLVVCHHVNGIFDSRGGPRSDVGGLMAFYRHGDAIGEQVAGAIMRAAPQGLRRSKSEPYKAKPDDWTRDAFWVLSHYDPIPSVLVEWGFATNPDDAKILQAVESRPALCAAAAVGVARCLELVHT